MWNSDRVANNQERLESSAIPTHDMPIVNFRFGPAADIDASPATGGNGSVPAGRRLGKQPFSCVKPMNGSYRRYRCRSPVAG